MPIQSLTGSFTVVSRMWVVEHYMKQVNLVSNSISPLNYLHHALKQPFSNIKLKCTTTIAIEVIIKSLKTRNSHGYDDVSTKILKISTPYILSPLTYICNKVLATGVFPVRLNYSEII
jgi:hypothetical protein